MDDHVKVLKMLVECSGDYDFGDRTVAALEAAIAALTHPQPVTPAMVDSLKSTVDRMEELNARQDERERKLALAVTTPAVDGESFICYLIDNCEREVIHEESLHEWLADFLKNPRYHKPVTPAGGEVWVPVVGFEGLYEVSDAGQVRILKTGELLSDRNRMGAGYVKVTLWKDGEKTQTSMHRVVASAFPVDGEGDEVNHKNGIKTDNRADNLEWVTRAGNEQHSRYVLGHLCQPIVAVNLDAKEVRRFPSQAKAAEELGLPYDRIRQCLTGYRETAKGWQFFREGQMDHPPVADAALVRLNFLLDNHATVEMNGEGLWRVAYEWTSPATYGPYAGDKLAAIDAALNQRCAELPRGHSIEDAKRAILKKGRGNED